MGIDFKSLTEATSGAVGGLLSTTLLYPLDTCKTKYQAEAAEERTRKYNSLFDVLKEAVETKQLRSLYQGLGAKNLQSVISQFVYFYSYSYFKQAYLGKTGRKSMGMAVNLLVAAAAGAVTCLVTQPLDTASTKMQTSNFGKSKSLRATLSSDCMEAFDGLGASLLLTSNPAIQYTVFEQLKNYILRRHLLEKRAGSPGTEISSGPSSDVLSMSTAFILGALSKTVATVLTYPAIRCKVLIQAGDKQSKLRDSSVQKPQASKSMVHVMWLIWKTEGALGFYKGLNAQILKTVLSAAVMLAIKEKTGEATTLMMLSAQRWSHVFQQAVLMFLAGSRTRQLAGTTVTFGSVLKKYA